MDANRTPKWLWTCGLLVVCGCMDPFQYPAAHQERPGPPKEEQPPEPPQVVETKPAPKPQTANDEINSGIIERWIERIDDAQTRADRRKPWQPHDSAPARQVCHTEPSPAPPPITVIPQTDPNVPTSSPASQSASTPDNPATHAPASRPSALAPPQLGPVTVRAASDIRIAPADHTPPEINAPVVARFGGPTSLREFLQQMPLPDDGSFREQVDRRMLWVIVGDYDRAREPLDLVSAEQQELGARFVDAWIAIRSGHMGDLTDAANTAARRLAELQESLRQISDPKLPVVEICSAVRSYGQYDVIEPPRFLAGTPSEFVLYCEVTDFVSELRSDNYYYTSFDMTTTIFNRAGDPVWQVMDPGILDRCRSRRHDCFIPRLIRLPTSLSPGRYVAKVTIVDKLAQKVAENAAHFELVARP